MKEYLFEGEIQGQYKSLQIYPETEKPHHYFVHWDGFRVGTIKKVSGEWKTDDEPLSDFVPEIGAFIDKHEAEIEREG